MRTMPLFGLLLLGLAGCDSVGKTKVDNPVAGPPPPRVNVAGRPSGRASLGSDSLVQVGTSESAGEVRLVSAQSPGSDDALFGLQPVAIVNGQPILAADILERYGASLEEAQKKMSPEQFRQARLELIERDLPGHIDRILLAAALQSSVKPEQIKALNEAIGKAFDEEAAKMMKELQVHSRHELDLELRKQKTSLASLRDNFIMQHTAMEYINFKSGPQKEVGRPELLAYYESNADEYAIPAKVKWQQILIAFRNEDERQEALDKLEQAIAELKSGADFGEVARRYSDGYNAETGGHFGWTEADSLADEKVARALFSMPVGTVSEIFEDRTTFQLVKVTERQDAGRVSFEQVQDEIREKLEKANRRELAERLLQELRENATIVTTFDERKIAEKSRERS